MPISKLTLALTALIGISGGTVEADCPEGTFRDVPLKVDTIRVVYDKHIEIIMSGFPPGFYRVKCAAYDKEGTYLGVDETRAHEEPVTVPAARMVITIGDGANDVIGAKCSARAVSPKAE
jgi:hypothetical protein